MLTSLSSSEEDACKSSSISEAKLIEQELVSNKKKPIRWIILSGVL